MPIFSSLSGFLIGGKRQQDMRMCSWEVSDAAVSSVGLWLDFCSKVARKKKLKVKKPWPYFIS
jgi:hypothetical protein